MTYKADMEALGKAFDALAALDAYLRDHPTSHDLGLLGRVRA